MNKEATNTISAYENDSVTLCATVSHERVTVRWLKDGQLLDQDNIHISSEDNTHKLTINPLQLSDSGEYVCDINTDEMYFSLLVKGKNLAPVIYKCMGLQLSQTSVIELIRNEGDIYQTSGVHGGSGRQEPDVIL